MSGDERAIRDVIQTWVRASAEGDLDRVLSLMSDDVIFVTASQPPFGKEAFAAASRAAAGRVRFEGTNEVLEVSITGDTAYTRTRLQITVTPQGSEPKRMSGYTMSVFRKQSDGRWLLTRDANLLTPKPVRRGIRTTVPVLQVKSVTASIDWYRDVLGFSADLFGPSGEPVFAILHRDGTELMLQKVAAGTQVSGTIGSGMSAYIRVLDIGAIRDAVAAKFPEVGPMHQRQYGCREFAVTDPGGHVLVFGECQ